MSALLIILACAGWLAVTILRGMAADEVRGHIARRISARVEATIATLPPELQDEWADEWRAEIAAAITMPVTAALLARGLRHSASQLIGDAILAPASAHPQQHRSALKRAPERVLTAARGTLSTWIRRVDRAAIVNGLASAIVVSFVVVIFGVVIVIVGDGGGVVGALAACVLFGIAVVIIVGVGGVDLLLVLATCGLFGAVVVAVGGVGLGVILAACILFGVVVVAVGVVVEEHGPRVTPAGRLRAVLEGHGDELVLTAEQAREVDAMLKSWGERPPAR